MSLIAQALQAVRSRPREQERDGSAAQPGESYVAGDGWDTSTGVTWAPPPVVGKPSVTHPYRETVIWRAALKALAEPFSRLPLVLWSKDPKEKGARNITEDQPGHPLVRMWQRPNPLLTGSALWKLHMIGYREGGETYLFLTDLDGQPVAADAARISIPASVIPVFRWGIQPEGVRRGDGLPASYKTKGQPDKIRPFPPEAVIRIFDHDPYDWTRGFGDGNALAGTHDLTHQASRYLASFVRSGGDPGAWVKHKNRLGPAERARLQSESDDTFSNSSGGRSRYRHIGGDVDVIPNPVRPRDMEYGQLFKYTQSMTLALCGVPGPIIGDLERATYNNIQVVELLMWRGPNGILSTARSTEDALNEQFLRRVKGVDPRWVYRYDTSEVEVLQKDNANELKMAHDMAARGVGTSVRDNLDALGAEAPLPDDAGHERWLAANLRTVDDRAGERVANVLGTLAAQVAARQVPPEAAHRIALVSFPGSVDAAAATAMFPDPGPAPEPPPQAPPVPPGEELPVGEDEGEELAARAASRAGRTTSGILGGARAVSRPANPSGAIYAFQPGKPIEPDATLAGLVESWLDRFWDEQLALWNSIARGVDSLQNATPIAALLHADAAGDRYREDIPESILRKFVLANAEWAAILEGLAGPQAERLFLDALAATQEAIGGPFISATDPRVLQSFVTQRLEFTRITSTLTDEIQDLLFSNLTGEIDTVEVVIARKLPELDEGLRKVFGTKEARANAISRTETGRAQNQAQYLQMQDAGVSRVGWRHSGNPEGRKDHIALDDGTSVPIGQKFSNGLRFPHAPEGDAGDVVNCACSVYAAEFEGDSE